eukprot:2722646-Prymnesium_polylepis.1
MTPGKRSDVMPLKRGMSGDRNLGTLTSRMERSTSSFSSSSGKALRRERRATRTRGRERVPQGSGWEGDGHMSGPEPWGQRAGECSSTREARAIGQR